MWFHRDFRFDDWLLYAVDQITSGGRGLVRGQFFTRDGMLVASTIQEGVIRRHALADGVSTIKKPAFRRRVFLQVNLLLDAHHRCFTNGYCTIELDQLFDVIHVGDDNRVRVDFALASSRARSNSMMVSLPLLHLLTFSRDTGKAFALQLDGIDAEVDK